ncbi:unnamed protein product [Arabidopsis halleri]
MISFALERAIGLNCSIEFEVADCTTKHYPDNSTNQPCLGLSSSGLNRKPATKKAAVTKAASSSDSSDEDSDEESEDETECLHGAIVVEKMRR